MAQFSKTINKLSKIWNRSKKTEAELDKKNIEDNDLYNKLQTFKYPITLVDSGNLYIKPNSTPSIRTTKKNEKLPSTLAYNAEIDISIPREFLPFLKLEVDWFPLPDQEVVGAFVYEQSDYTGNQVEIKGDGTLIYAGNKSKLVSSFFPIFTQDDIDNGSILEANTKKVYQASIVYQDTLGDTYKIVGILYNAVWKNNIGTGCSGFETFDDYTLQFDPSLSNFLYFSEINDITSSGINATTQKREVDWSDPGGGCMQSVLTTDSVTQTFTFSGYQEFYQLQQATKYKLISGEFVEQPLATQFLVDERDPVNDTIISRDFTFLGYWLHYSSDRRTIVGIGNDNLDGEVDDLLLLPDTTDVTGLPLPYSSITFKQNPDNLTAQKNSATTVQGSQGLPFVFKEISKSTDSLPTFRINALIRAILVSRATKDNPNSQTFDTYDDEYTVSGTTYTKTTENHDTITRTTYVPQNQDTKFRYKVKFNNPLFFSQQQTYKNFGDVNGI